MAHVIPGTRRALFADGAVGDFAHDVQVAGVPGVLLQDVHEDPPECRTRFVMLGRPRRKS